MNCQWQMGMLVMRECGAPATGACSLCGQTLCMAHTVMGQQGPACPGCASHTAGYEQTDDTEIADAREHYFTQYGGAAQFGNRRYFSGADSASMAQRGVPQSPARTERYNAKET